MVEVIFEYYDKYCRDGKWNRQSGIYRSVKDCIEWNGLGVDCDYRIISVTEVK